MNMAQPPQGASRFTGIGVVIVVHALMIAGLSSGLMRGIIDSKPRITEARLIKEDPPPPPTPVPRVEPQDPTRQVVVQQQVIETPDFTVVTPTEVPPGTAGKLTLQTGKGSSHAGPTVAPPAGIPVVNGKVDPGLVCTKMGRPDLPAVNWAGDALFRVQATVRGGRVAATEFTVLSGVMDPKTRRTLQAAIANTLRDTYECPGEHRFEQEFNIRID
ncbi:hypothetical protein [Roseateles microcysteis]|uniref:hypothetical protein n=1 Tax=Roseateles microcysteis TaxID=3119057 RepID=UPI002FE6A510